MNGDILAVAVRVVRSASDMTQEELARKTLSERSFISRLESGKANNPEMVYRIIYSAGGEQMLERLIERLKEIKSWFSAQHSNRLLYV